MATEHSGICRHFISYSGVMLPLKLVSPLEEGELDNRNTFFRGYYDESGVLMSCQKVVYGDIELEHVYEYHVNGHLKRAEITDVDGDVEVLNFDEAGERLN